MKLLKKFFIILIIACLVGIPAMAEEGEHDGYIVKYKGEEDFVVCDEIPLSLFGMRSDIEYVEPNYYRYLLGNIPTDPFYAGGNQWNLSVIKAETMWQQGYKGEGVTIAVIDSGVDTECIDLGDCLLEGINCVAGADEADYSDNVGHGTMICGLIAAKWNKNGIAGIAPSAKIKPIKCTKIIEGSEQALDTDIARGIEIAIEEGCQIINLSLGSSAPSKAMQDAINKAYNAGIIIFAAAGNDYSTDVMYPAGCDNVIGVGSVSRASDGSIVHSEFSHRNESVFAVAPGDNLTLVFYDNEQNANILAEGCYGTSFSCPTVAAVAALVLSAKPTLTNDEISTVLKICCDDFGDNGYDTQFGYGLINCDRIFKILSGQGVYASPIKRINNSISETTLINWTDDNETLRQINYVKNNNGSISDIQISYITIDKGETKPIQIQSKGGTGRFLITEKNIMNHISDIMEY